MKKYFKDLLRTMSIHAIAITFLVWTFTVFATAWSTSTWETAWWLFMNYFNKMLVNTLPTTNWVSKKAQSLWLEAWNTTVVSLSWSNVGIGTKNPTQKLTIVKDSTLADWQNIIEMKMYKGAGLPTSVSPIFRWVSMRWTECNPSYLTKNDRIALFLWHSTGSNAFSAMWMFASEDHSASAQWSRIEFRTTPNGTTNARWVASLTQDGNLQMAPGRGICLNWVCKTSW
jgi:hypothetical protein